MPTQRHPTPFRPGDRVGMKYSFENEVLGTFDMYAPGQLSHCRVKWDDGRVQKIKADKLRLVEQGRS